MFISILTAMLLLVQDEQTVTRTVTVQGPALNIPDEFAPAATTYFACKIASQGVPLRQGPNGPAFNPDNIQPGHDCSEIRNREMKRAMLMLKSSDMSKKKRKELVEQTFDQIDAFATYKPGPAPGGKE